MKPAQVPGASTAELADAYRRATAAYGEAMLASDHVAANRQQDVFAAIYRELRSRGLSSQQVLLRFLGDPDKAVRMWSAAHALEFAPELAEPVLRDIENEPGIDGYSAEMTLQQWRKGQLRFP